MNILCIADIHFAKIPNEKEMYDALVENFIGYANEVKPELIVICGDSYDCRVNIESPANNYFNRFITKCIETGATIIVLEGTEAHDRYQINGLAHYSSDKFFIVNSVSEFNLLGLKLLILPEEYVKNDNYYDEYLNKKYDFIFGHGMASHVGFSSINNDELVRKPYVWEAKKLEKICKYYTVFGHIHTHSEYHKFIYCGSFSRLNFGEMEDKGFIHLKLENDKCSWKFIKNKNAPLFTDIYESKLSDDVDNLMKQLRGYQENNDFLRVIIDQPDENKMNNIKGFVKSHQANCCIKQVINSNEKRLTEISENIKEKQKLLSDRMKEYENMDMIEITQTIAKRDYHVDLTKEEIYSVINTQI